MSDVAYFEYATVIPPVGNQRAGTPAHYVVAVMVKNPVSGEKRNEREVQKIANDFLALALSREVDLIPGVNEISESEAQKLNKIRSVGLHHDGSVFLVE